MDECHTLSGTKYLFRNPALINASPVVITVVFVVSSINTIKDCYALSFLSILSLQLMSPSHSEYERTKEREKSNAQDSTRIEAQRNNIRGEMS